MMQFKGRPRGNRRNTFLKGDNVTFPPRKLRFLHPPIQTLHALVQEYLWFIQLSRTSSYQERPEETRLNYA
jgi:hypothetical protein